MTQPEPSAPEQSTTPRPVNRRFQAIASVLILLAALGLWGASRMKWATVLVGEDPPYPSREVTVTGSDWSPWLVAVALAMVAAVVAQFAVRGMLLRLVAVLVALGGAVSVIPAISLLTEGEGNLYVVKMAGVSSRSPIVGIPVESMPGYLVIASAVCAVVGAVFMMRTANQGGMSSKYNSPAARREELERKVFAERERAAAAGEPVKTETNERLLWDSLDEGIDPTDDEK